MAVIELDGVHKSFGNVHVIKGVDIRIENGEFAVFVGPSGCGKSTLMRLIAGLETMSEGEFRLDGQRMNEVAPDKRGIAMVFQTYALYPHMTVAENIGFSLDLKKVPKEDIRRQVEEVTGKLQLSGLLDRKPAELSGGQRQRVAIGRAIIKKPSVILFDEPLSNLDAALRVQMRAELQRLHQELEATVVYVTHDQVEAMTMADRITILNDGLVAQTAPPIDLYNHPRNTFVATFIGSPRMNLVKAVAARTSAGELVARTGTGWQIGLPDSVAEGAELSVGVRPEHLSLADPRPEGAMDVAVVERLGVETYVTVGDVADPVIVRMEGDVTLKPGARVSVDFLPDRCHVFDREGDLIPSAGGQS